MSSSPSRRPKIRQHFTDAREDAIRLAQEAHAVAYVRCDPLAGYFASLEPGRNPLASYDPARLPALPVCPLAQRGWVTGRKPKAMATCPGCGRAIYVKMDGTCTPHRPKRRPQTRT